MNPKTVLGVSFATVFVLSIISAVAVIQADTAFKIKHLPNLRASQESINIERVSITVATDKIAGLTSFSDDLGITAPSLLNKQLKN